MKYFKKTTAILLSILILMSALTTAVSAITVEKDGKSYQLSSPTPTTGDCNVLIIRVGFPDYPLDDEFDSPDSEEKLLSYFDGSEDSVNGFYETSSYGKLHLSCDKIYNYTTEYDRDHYEVDSSLSDELLDEVLNGLKDEIDYDRFDSNNDGNLDFLCIDFAGPIEGWATTWWPCVTGTEDVSVEGKKVPIFSLIRGDADTFIHEFGHILGIPDYYSYNDGSTPSIMTFDIMGGKGGDHNGFSKWGYGWLSNDDIAFVDKAGGDTTVNLAPFETGLGDGKKIAVIAPELDRDARFLDEFLLVEYDTGEGNNKTVFDYYNCEPGFRIFHVNAGAEFNDEETTVSLIMSNRELRNNLIHNIKNEYGDPNYLIADEMFYREGDSLTPYGYPNTGFASGKIFNGRFSGISITDFVTGENPSFKVSFSDEAVLQPEAHLSLEYENPGSDVNMTLVSDQPVIMSDPYVEDCGFPYLLDEDGQKYKLDIKTTDSTHFQLSYSNFYPSVHSETEYTLVIPERLLMTGYDQIVPEYRQKIRTGKFMEMTSVGRYGYKSNAMSSNIFSVTDKTFGRIELNTETLKCYFFEYNLNGELVSRVILDAPMAGDSVFSESSSIHVYSLLDGNFGFYIYSAKKNYLTKIDKNGNLLSKTYIITKDQLKGYAFSLLDVELKPYKGGLIKEFESDDYTKKDLLKIDFENEPTFTETSSDKSLVSLNEDNYVIKHYSPEGLHLELYDKNDQLKTEVIIPERVFGMFIKDEKLYVLKCRATHDIQLGFSSSFYVDAYDMSGKLVSSIDITDHAGILSSSPDFDSVVPTESGYYALIKDTVDSKTTVFAYDQDWNKLGEFQFDSINVTVAFSGECSLFERRQFNTDGDTAFMTVARINIGPFEIVEKQDIPRYLGDVDGDEDVTIFDATVIQRRLASIPVSFFDEEAADADGDEDISILDATAIQRFLADLPTNEAISKPLA